MLKGTSEFGASADWEMGTDYFRNCQDDMLVRNSKDATSLGPVGLGSTLPVLSRRALLPLQCTVL